MVYKKEYQKRYELDHKQERYEYNKQYYIKNKQKKVEYYKQYYIKNQAVIRKQSRINQYNLWFKTLCKIAGSDHPTCVNCGCNDLLLLQINHVKGGGSQDIKMLGHQRILYNQILSGKRDIKDFDVRCAICNWLHFYELKFNKKLPYMVNWDRQKLPHI